MRGYTYFSIMYESKVFNVFTLLGDDVVYLAMTPPLEIYIQNYLKTNLVSKAFHIWTVNLRNRRL